MLELSDQAAQLRHHPERRAAGLHALNVVEAVAVRLRPVVPRRPGAVRREGDVREREERVVLGRRLLHHHVEAGGGDRPRRERLIQRVLVDDRAAAGVDENRAALHHRELARGHHLTSDVVQRYVQGHHVGGAKELGEEGEADAERVLLILAEPEDVEVANVHVEALDAARDLLTDVAETDDAEPLALDLVGASGGEVADAPFAGDDVVVVVHEFLEHGEHEHDGVLGDGDGVGATVVGDGHTGLARGLDVDAIVARAGQLYELELGRGAEELVADALPRRAQVVLGVDGGVVELWLTWIGDDQLHAGWEQIARDFHDGGGLGGREDLGHGLLLRSWMLSRHSIVVRARSWWRVSQPATRSDEGSRQRVTVDAARLAIPGGRDAIATSAAPVGAPRGGRRSRRWSAPCAPALPGDACLPEGARTGRLAAALRAPRRRGSQRAARCAVRRRAGAAPAMVGGGGHRPRPDSGRRRPVALAALVLPVRDHARRARGRARYRRHTCRLARGARRALPLERHPEAQRHLHDTPLPLAGGAPRRRAAGWAAANFVSRLDGGSGDGDHGGRGPARAAPPKRRGGGRDRDPRRRPRLARAARSRDQRRRLAVERGDGRAGRAPLLERRPHFRTPRPRPTPSRRPRRRADPFRGPARAELRRPLGRLPLRRALLR